MHPRTSRSVQTPCFEHAGDSPWAGVDGILQGWSLLKSCRAQISQQRLQVVIQLGELFLVDFQMVWILGAERSQAPSLVCAWARTVIPMWHFTATCPRKPWRNIALFPVPQTEQLRHQLKPLSLAHGRFRSRSHLSGCSACLTSCSSRWQTLTEQFLGWREAQRQTTFCADLAGWPRQVLAQSLGMMQSSIPQPSPCSSPWLH